MAKRRSNSSFLILLVNCHRGDRSQVDGLGNCCSLVENGRIIGMMGDLGVAPCVGVGGKRGWEGGWGGGVHHLAGDASFKRCIAL